MEQPCARVLACGAFGAIASLTCGRRGGAPPAACVCPEELMLGGAVATD